MIKIMTFDDWMKSKEKDENWTTVAQSRKFVSNGIDNDFFTISILANQMKHRDLVKDYDWFSEVNFGNPEVWNDLTNNKLRYSPNNIIEKNGIQIEPFIIYRSWHKKSLEFHFKIIEDFILFYNLYWDRNDKIYKAIAETGEEYEAIRINLEKDQKYIEINTKFLKNYLAIKNKILIRQHDLTRHTFESLKSLIKKESADLSYNDTDYNYRLIMAEQPCSSYNSFSRLLGKDLILPYSEGRALLEWEKKYENFIIKTDENGKEIHITCDEKKLSNFSQNKGTPHFLTPVYFKKDVLRKYYDCPSKYSVSSSSVSCNGLWFIHIDEYKNLIQIWLGDLGRIPYHEQQHWKQYNAISDGKITSSRFKRDFMAKFCDPEDIMFRFHKEFDEFQKKFAIRFGFHIFMPLKHEDIYICETLRIPLNNEQPEFDSQMSNLAKILPDSIDITSIKQYLVHDGLKRDELKDIEDKKIRCMDIFLKRNSIDTDLIAVLDLIQNIRSRCTAHRRGEACIQLLKKYGLNEKSNIEIFNLILNDLIMAFKKMI